MTPECHRLLKYLQTQILNGGTNGELTATSHQLMDLGFTSGTITKVLREAKALGLVEISHVPGGINRFTLLAREPISEPPKRARL